MDGFSNQALSAFAKRCLGPTCTVVSDGLQCFARVTDAGCSHQPIVTGGGPASVRKPAFKWVNTALGNIKAAIVGTYRAVNSKHVPRYLAEFEYRFNRRYDLAAMLPRLCWAGVRTPPMPYRLPKYDTLYGFSEYLALNQKVNGNMGICAPRMPKPKYYLITHKPQPI